MYSTVLYYKPVAEPELSLCAEERAGVGGGDPGEQDVLYPLLTHSMPGPWTASQSSMCLQDCHCCVVVPPQE